jgi:DNA modification methylase
MDAPVNPQKNRKSRKASIDAEVLKKNKLLLQKIHSGLSIKELNGFESLVNYKPLSNKPIHRWFKYREGYSTELVKELIKDLPKGSVILDPFCGAGTTLLAAQDLGYESIGFDINPMSTLIAEVKTSNYSKKDISTIAHELSEVVKLSKKSESDNKPELKIIDKVFNKEILASLLTIRHHIKTIENKKHREFLKVAWLSILEELSNAYKEGNGIKYRNRKRTPDGYINIPQNEWEESNFPKDKFEFVKERFKTQVQLMIADITLDKRKKPKATVYNITAESMSQHIDFESVNYVIFSPPYCNCFNYFKIFKIELWMGEFVNSYKEMQALNRGGLRSHVETPLKKSTDIELRIVSEFTDQIDPEKVWDKRIPLAVNGYFQDMMTVLGETYKVLSPKGACSIVVGNSSYAGILIPTDALLAKIGEMKGFDIRNIEIARHLTTSSQQVKLLGDRKEFLRESIVNLNKKDKSYVKSKAIMANDKSKNVPRGKKS